MIKAEELLEPQKPCETIEFYKNKTKLSNASPTTYLLEPRVIMYVLK